jgi:glycerophosphoryl diester phosphodiesterase
MRLIPPSLAVVVLLAGCAPAPEAPASTARSFADFLDCVRESGVGHVSAHRGGIPENSLTGLFLSAGLGAAAAEIDVARTADGAFVLLHDRTLDRTTTGTGPIAETTLSELRSVTLADAAGNDTGAPVPTLEEALALAGELGLYLQLDVKGVPLADLLDVVRAAGALDRVGLITYTAEDALAAHRLAPRMQLSAPDALDVYRAADVDLSRISVWLGVGMPDATRDAQLAALGVETGAGMFPFERRQIPADYYLAADAGIELLSVDEVDRAIRSLGGAEAVQSSLDRCRSGS